MRKIIGVLLCIFLSVTAVAQTQAVSWTSYSERMGDGLYKLSIHGSIDDGWHIYDMGPYKDGPSATSVIFDYGPAVVAEGELEVMGERHSAYEEIFSMQIGYFETEVTFSQLVRISSDEASVKAVVEYMCCDDTNCLPPTEEEFTFILSAGVPGAELSSSDAASDSSGPDGGTDGAKGLWALIIEAVLWGFAALLTPCVFPMVPMTVSYFLKGKGGAARGRLRAALYGLFIVLLYTVPIALVIIITRIAGGDAVTADIFNWLATHWLPNIIFFLVFMLFAASFFGAFEIVLPSSLVNKADSKADTKGLAGIFFLALTLVLVSFSCTGPIVGSVLIKSTSGEFWAPVVTMLAFSTAFALPFTVLALFPSLLKSLPKSGGWLNTVKVVIAFIEVALGFKFLSTADQTYHWGLLDREVYLAIWITVFSLLGLYLLGKIRFAHDDEIKHLSVGRLSLSIAVFSFVVYMIPGMWGAPLKALSGYLPPLSSQDFVLDGAAMSSSVSASSEGTAFSDSYSFQGFSDAFAYAGQSAEDYARQTGVGLHQLAHGLKAFPYLDEARAYASAAGKPVFLDFTGHGCVNCREMEARVWSDPRVLEILKRDYVICALYSDDKLQAPQDRWVTTDSGRVLKSIGKINSYFALKTFGVNAQPYYVLLGNGSDKPLVKPRSYDLDVEAFVDFLEAGKKAYRSDETVQSL